VPKIDLVLFAEENGTSPLLEWLDKQPEKAQDKCALCVLSGLLNLGMIFGVPKLITCEMASMS